MGEKNTPRANVAFEKLGLKEKQVFSFLDGIFSAVNVENQKHCKINYKVCPPDVQPFAKSWNFDTYFPKKHECKTPSKNIHEKHPRTVHTHFRRASATPRVTKNESKINHPRGRKGEHHALLSSFQTWEQGFQHFHSLKLT